MKNRRLILSVIIKLMTYLGLILLMLVMLNSLFIKESKVEQKAEKEALAVILDLADMFKGQIRKTRWNNREVGVLFRQFPEKALSQNVTKEDNSKERLSKDTYHSSINKQMRSKNKDYFVYFNIGDSSNCPLFYAGGVFKDVCSSNTFDETGRSITPNSQQFELEVPPHYFKDGSLFVGKWKLD